MAMRTCPDCKTSVSTGAMSCPSCGRVLRRPPRMYGCGTILALILLGLVALLIYSANANRRPIDPITGRPAGVP